METGTIIDQYKIISAIGTGEMSDSKAATPNAILNWTADFEEIKRTPKFMNGNEQNDLSPERLESLDAMTAAPEHHRRSRRIRLKTSAMAKYESLALS
jgi:hypothetical protein